MSKIQNIFLIVVLTVSLVSASQVITLTCATVATSTCASGYRFRVQGSYETVTLDSYYCVPVNQTCTNNAKAQFNLQTCKIDYKAKTCSTGVCFMYPQAEVCTLDKTCGTTDVPKAYYANYKCDNCTTVSNCVKCLYTTTNEVNNTDITTQSCLGVNCTEGLATTTSTVGRCNGGFDAFGQKCECCVKTLEVSRFCTSNSGALSQADVTTWFNKVEGNTTFEYKMQMVIALLVLALFGIVY